MLAHKKMRERMGTQIIGDTGPVCSSKATASCAGSKRNFAYWTLGSLQRPTAQTLRSSSWHLVLQNCYIAWDPAYVSTICELWTSCAGDQLFVTLKTFNKNDCTSKRETSQDRRVIKRLQFIWTNVLVGTNRVISK